MYSPEGATYHRIGREPYQICLFLPPSTRLWCVEGREGMVNTYTGLTPCAMLYRPYRALILKDTLPLLF